MLERDFQSSLIKELKEMYPDSIVLKNDPTYIQGMPDLLILKDGMWAALECKRSDTAPHRPNQEYYVDLMDHMSFASFIYPENRREVLYDLERFFKGI